MKRLLFLVIAAFVIVFAGLVLLSGDEVRQQEVPRDKAAESELQATPLPTMTEYTAEFEINTLGTKRTFTNSRYHDLSEDVYIPAENPDIVVVKDFNATWAELFDSLPMSLNKECLITGTNQTFCTNETNQLRFYIKDIEDENALDRKIKEGDVLRVVYE